MAFWETEPTLGQMQWFPTTYNIPQGWSPVTNVFKKKQMAQRPIWEDVLGQWPGWEQSRRWQKYQYSGVPEPQVQFPTGEETLQAAWDAPGMEQLRQMVSQMPPEAMQIQQAMGSPEAMAQAFQPTLEAILRQIGSSGLPSSTYAQRMFDVIPQTWAQNLPQYMTAALQPWQSQVTGWQNMMSGIPSLGGLYLTPYQNMLSLMGTL